ncbi:MAG: hypothetical protein HW394_2064 [Acidobacteria bacterium]|nr:hypothetical protein [Acidobacteriota bacterium]
MSDKSALRDSGRRVALTGTVPVYNLWREEMPMKALHVLAAAVVGLVSFGVPLSAHHAWPVSRDKLVTVRGTVSEFTWANPHPMMTVEVRADDGRVEKWVIGGPALNRMEGNGWTRTTVKVGDEITGVGYQFADGQKIIRLETVTLANGKEMRLYGR